MTITDPLEIVATDPGVYTSQHDSRLLIKALQKTSLAPGRHVLDLCTGNGVLAVAAAQLGALSLAAFDICPRAVRCSRANAKSVGVQVNAQMGSLTDALARGPFDVVVSNPPYVPTGPEADSERIPLEAGSARARNAGGDGRLVLDPLCAAAPDLLTGGGTMLIVQSEFSGVEQSPVELRARGLDAEILMWQWVPLVIRFADRSVLPFGVGFTRIPNRPSETIAGDGRVPQVLPATPEWDWDRGATRSTG